ncbi:MAG: hypothetical protein LBN11_02630, partial [Tannerella sp.]|nr:hypothetical protein [Tannerella sp.]
MKLKSLFLGMLGAALFVGCNNESVVNPDLEDGGVSGESTTATFQFKIKAPGTYAGVNDVLGSATESKITDIALFIYKDDAAITPEAMGYLTGTDLLDDAQDQTSASTKEATARLTLKCKSGAKLIYMAANIGGNKLINHLAPLTNNVDPWLGVDWSLPANNPVQFVTLNTPIWSLNTNTIVLSSTIPASLISATPPSSNAGGILKALTNNGDPGVTNAAIGGPNTIGTAYLMSNWGDQNSTQPDNTIGVPGTDYVSTCKFILKAEISASDSRTATADATNANKKNALLINIQRAVAKIAMPVILPGVLGDAGNAAYNKGTFAPEAN